MRWLVLAALCLPACKGKPAPAPKRDDARVQPADAATPDAAIDAAPPPDASTRSTTITSEGVGPITMKINEEDELQELFPGTTVTSEHFDSEDYEYDELTVKKGETRLLRAVVTGSRLFKVVVYDPMFSTAAGGAVGVTVGELAEKHRDLTCVYEKYDPEADAERVERSLRCESPSLRQVMFEIDHETYKGKEGKVSAKAIAKRKIVELVWLAPEA